MRILVCSGNGDKGEAGLTKHLLTLSLLRYMSLIILFDD